MQVSRRRATATARVHYMYTFRSTDWHAVCDCRCARAGGAWIRALSLKDPVEGATRPDHGKWGAYAAWPPLVAEAFAELSGEFEQTLMILRGAEGVARQGPFGQATQLRPSPGANSTGALNGTLFYGHSSSVASALR